MSKRRQEANQHRGNGNVEDAAPGGVRRAGRIEIPRRVRVEYGSGARVRCQITASQTTRQPPRALSPRQQRRYGCW